MKTASAPLLALLAKSDFVSADCWTVTLVGGGIVRWTSADVALTLGGNVFAKGPAILRGAISEKRGVEVASLSVDITASPTDLINGTPIIPFIAKHGLDGAIIKLERAFAPNWPAAAAGAMTGSIIRFAGRVTSINAIQGLTASLTVSSWLVLLNASMPRNLYQAGCLHSVYDAGCGLSPASFSTSSTVSVGAAGNSRTFGCALTPTANDYALGRVLFTTGANAGVSRTIRSNDASGNFVLISPLPANCASGDAFTVYKGCDHTQATCSSKFSNLPNFRGTPFVPLPTAAIGSVTTTTTTGGK